ncbi:MAG TPA: hypothetical protein VEK76_03220 [Candidatus Binatia bacterium]|nr:hypothetical protein [Candidatus Binatia bacterium]
MFRFLLADVTRLDAGEEEFGAACIDADDLSDGDRIKVDDRRWRVIEVDWSTLDPTVEPPTVLGFVEPDPDPGPSRSFTDVAAGELSGGPRLVEHSLPVLVFPADWN